MNDQEVMQCMAVVQEVVDAETKPKAAVGGPFGGALDSFRLIVKWLRDNGVNLDVILKNLTKIISILTSADTWAVKIQALIAIFFASGTAPTVAAPSSP